MKQYKKSPLERVFKSTASHSIKANHAFKQAFSRRGKWLFVTSTPKSASTFLSRVLNLTTSFGEYQLTDDLDKENDLYLPKLIDAYNMNLVCRQHTKATPPNLKLARQFGIRPIVITRNLADTVVSVRDQIFVVGGVAWFWPPKSYYDFSEADQYTYIIDLFVPWCVDFVIGWDEAARNSDIPILTLTYDEIIANKTEAAQRALNHLDIRAPISAIEKAVRMSDGNADANFNVGIGGRGQNCLSAEQLDRIAEIEMWSRRLVA